MFTALSFVFVPKGLSALTTCVQIQTVFLSGHFTAYAKQRHSLNSSVSILKKETDSLQKKKKKNIFSHFSLVVSSW